MKRIIQLGSLVLFLATGSASATEQGAASTATQLTLDDLRTFTDVLSLVRDNYVEEVDDHTLLTAAIRGMLTELDPHSSYMDPDEFRQLDNTSRGRYGGIGIEAVSHNRGLEVLSVIDDGPAFKAGVVEGDLITAIDGRSIAGERSSTAIDTLRGDAGSEIEVTFEHDNGEVSTLTLVRGYLDEASVFSRAVDDSFGYFRVSHFTGRTAEEFNRHVYTMNDREPTKLSGVILDLRGNPGGVLKSAARVADGFLDNGLIVYTEGRAENQPEYTADPEQWFEATPTVVLVDRETASASEVLAGALQDHGRALIVGETTFGKGSVQSVLNLRNGAGFRLTTSRYYTPHGRSIQDQGIQPDVDISGLQAAENTDTGEPEEHPGRHLDTGAAANDETVFESEVSANEDFALYQALLLLKGADNLSTIGE